MPAELYGPAGALAALAFVLGAIIHGDLVPGFVYRKAEARADKAEAALVSVLSKTVPRPDDPSR